MVIESKHISLYVSKYTQTRTSLLLPQWVFVSLELRVNLHHTVSHDPRLFAFIVLQVCSNLHIKSVDLLHSTEHVSYADALWLHLADESALLMSDVAHIPQTAASHYHDPAKQHGAAADMLREDPRDSLHQGERRLSLAALLCRTADKSLLHFLPSHM